MYSDFFCLFVFSLSLISYSHFVSQVCRLYIRVVVLPENGIEENTMFVTIQGVFWDVFMVKNILKVTYFPPLVDESGVSVSHGRNLVTQCRKVPASGATTGFCGWPGRWLAEVEAVILGPSCVSADWGVCNTSWSTERIVASEAKDSWPWVTYLSARQELFIWLSQNVQ